VSPDIAGLRTNRRALLHHPMAAIVAAGGTGEMNSRTPARIWKLYGLWWRGGGRIPVISGTGFNVAIGVDLARQSANIGAAHAIRTLTTKDSPSAMLLSFRLRLSHYSFIAATG
jgi:dihydrodipicolinate synthase/N-acetylneuraminate lyase